MNAAKAAILFIVGIWALVHLSTWAWWASLPGQIWTLLNP